MVEEKKSILTVALDDETFQRIAPLLRRDSLSVRAATQGSEATNLAQKDRFNLVICRYPLPDLKLREFVTAIRAVGSASRFASLLLLTIPEMATEARSGVHGGPFLVFSGQEPLGLLGQGAAHLLEVAPRNAPRISTRLRTSVEEGSETFEGWIVNLSRTGMLVKETPMLPVGSICFFEFTLPSGEVIRGRAEVVRHAKPRRERVTGFGVRFIEFEPGCREALFSWSETESG
jgi:CheY-like chemotaxis protein